MCLLLSTGSHRQSGKSSECQAIALAKRQLFRIELQLWESGQHRSRRRFECLSNPITSRTNNLMVILDTRPARMDKQPQERMPIVAMIVLGGVLAWLAISRPGNLGGEFTAFKIIPTLAAVSAVCYASWRFHSYLAALATLILFRYLDPTEPTRVAWVERGTDAALLVTLWIGMVAGTRQGRQGNAPWLLLLLLALGVQFFAWFGYGLPISEDAIARERVTHLMLIVSILAFFVGYLGTTESWADRFKLIGLTIGVPLAGLIAAKLVRGEVPQPWSGGDWGQLTHEWKDSIDSGSWKSGVWCWTLPWVCARHSYYSDFGEHLLAVESNISSVSRPSPGYSSSPVWVVCSHLEPGRLRRTRSLSRPSERFCASLESQISLWPRSSELHSTRLSQAFRSHQACLISDDKCQMVANHPAFIISQIFLSSLLFRTQGADGLAGLPHFAVGDFLQFLLQLLPVVRPAVGFERAAGFFAGLDLTCTAPRRPACWRRGTS